VSDEAFSESIGQTAPDSSPSVHPKKTRSPAAARPTSTNTSGDQQVADQKICDTLVRKIQELDARLARNEDEAVRATIEKGQCFLELKALAKRTWSKQLDKLHLNPRVASRLVAIGKWGREIGPIGSELLARLPHDIHKLEWIVKLDPAPLRQLVEDFDCRAGPRGAVINAVKEMLGQAKPEAKSEDADSTLKAIEKVLKRLIDLLGGLDLATADGGATSDQCASNGLRSQFFGESPLMEPKPWVLFERRFAA
jgi:hypothetical protein